MPDQQHPQLDEVAAAATSALSTPRDSKFSPGKSLVSKRSMWSQMGGQGRTPPASDTEKKDSIQLSEGMVSQPRVQPTSLFSDTHMGKKPDPWGSSNLCSFCTNPKDMAEEIQKQQQQSFRRLLEQQNL